MDLTFKPVESEWKVDEAFYLVKFVHFRPEIWDQTLHQNRALKALKTIHSHINESTLKWEEYKKKMYLSHGHLSSG